MGDFWRDMMLISMVNNQAPVNKTASMATGVALIAASHEKNKQEKLEAQEKLEQYYQKKAEEKYVKQIMDRTDLKLGQKNAILTAKKYIEMDNYSFKQLMNYLMTDGFTKSEAEFGINYFNISWKEQAYRYGKNLMDGNPYSESALRQAMNSCEFTSEEIDYAIKKIGF